MRLAPKITIHPDRTATLSGVPFDTLKSILTAASLNHYDTEKEIERKRAEELPKEIERYDGNAMMQAVVCANQLDNEIWAARLRNTLDLIEKCVDRRYHYKPSWVGKRVVDLTPWEKKERIRAIIGKIDLRNRLDQIVQEAIAMRKASIASNAEGEHQN